MKGIFIMNYFKKILIFISFTIAIANYAIAGTNLVEVGGYLTYLKNRANELYSSVSFINTDVSVLKTNQASLQSDLTKYSLLWQLTNGLNSISLNISTSSEIIHVTETNRIYSLSVSSPNTISNDLSQIFFSGNVEKSWQIWINYLTTNALSTVWDSRMDFGGYVPDLTVTGQYKFVCSSVDGVTIQTKQVYPDVFVKGIALNTYTGQLLRANNKYVGTIATPHTFYLASPSNTNIENSIVVYANFTGTNSVIWGTNVLVYGTIPDVLTNELDLIYIWSNSKNKWKFGVLEAK